MYGMNPIAEKVRAERLRRKWSIRTAAARSRDRKGEGGISNTWWSRFENGEQPVTDAIRAGVARAFNWSEDWPSQPEVDTAAELRGQIAELRLAVAELLELAALAANSQLRASTAEREGNSL